MSRTFHVWKGLIAVMAPLLVLTMCSEASATSDSSVSGKAVMATSSPRMPAPLEVTPARGVLDGGCIKNRTTHVKMCIVDSYKYHRKVVIRHHWKRKAFWGAWVSTRHCRHGGCYGPRKVWRLPARWLYGKPVHARTTALRGGGDCPMSLLGINPLCSVPWSWFNDKVDKVTHKVVEVVVDPCAKGSIAGFGGVAATNLWTKVFFESGVITAAKAASRFEGPAGYAIATAASCTVAVGYHGYETVSDLFR